ncbi:MAG: hypothetical protein IBX61_03360 [Thermoleophilia bacterium]|nr:hypothetical protein [Thermoleophilia bacterium]
MDTKPGSRNKAPEPGPRGLIVIVGVCGSGKSVLARALRERGFRAESVAQEHSLVPELFLHPNPDIVIYLETSDDTVAERKQTAWEPHLLSQQRQRLEHARRRADIHIVTDGLSPEELLGKAEAALSAGF